MKGQIFLISTIFMSMSISAYEVYIVKDNETLTDIIYSKDLKPIYGKRGVLQRTLDLNKEIKKSNGNKIFPNMKIILANALDSTVITQDVQTTNHETHLKESTGQLFKQPIKELNEISNSPSPPKITDGALVSNEDFEQSFYWKVSPTLSWKSFYSSDTNIYRKSTINALSTTNYGMSATYGMHLEENIDIYSKLFLESVRFIQENQINLAQKSFLTTSFGMGFIYEKKWSFEALMRDEFFLTSPQVSSVKVEKVNLPVIKTAYTKDFYHYKKAKLFYSLSALAFLPRDSAIIKSKLSYGAGAALEAKLQNQSFKLGYDLSFLKATNNSTQVQNIYWNYILENL